MILLATTIRDGELLLSHGPGEGRGEVLIITPRNSAKAARGRVMSHIYSTPGFDALPAATQARVLADVLPTIATSPCERCHARWEQ